jgi:acetyl esterase/lipase
MDWSGPPQRNVVAVWSPSAAAGGDAVSRRSALRIAAGCAAAATLSCTARPGSSAADVPPTVYRYGDHPSQFGEITVPASPSGPLPVVVIIHGGFWLSSFGLELGRPLAGELARRGFAVVNVEYRRLGRGDTAGGGWPQTGQDVAAAVDALSTDGQRLAGGRLDLTRVVALGHSAGGQLAVWLAARRNAVVPLSGVVSQDGVLDLVAAADDGVGAGAVEDLLGGGPSAQPAAYADASPIARVPLGVPSVCVHGRADSVVPFDQSQRFVDAAVAAGDHSVLSPFDGDHFDPIHPGTEAWRLCVAALTSLVGTH